MKKLKRKNIIILISLLLLILVVIYFMFFNTNQKQLERKLKDRVNDYYLNNYYPQMMEQIERFKNEGIPITLTVLKDNGISTEEFKNNKTKKACKPDLTYGLIKFKTDAKDYQKDYEIEIFLDCGF